MPNHTSARTFKIVQEHSPRRCEVCHQTDQFDPETSHCLRCQAVFKPVLTVTQRQVPGLLRLHNRPQQLTFAGLASIAESALSHGSTRLVAQLFGVVAGIELPLAGLAWILGQWGSPFLWPLYLIVAPLSVWGAECVISRLVADSILGNQCSIGEAAQMIWNRRFPFLTDAFESAFERALEGPLYRWSMVVVGVTIGALVGEWMRLEMTFGVMFGLYFWIGVSVCTQRAFSRSLLVNQISILGQDVVSDAWQRSSQLGEQRMFKLLNAALWLVRIGLASLVVAPSLSQILSLTSPLIWYPMLPVYLAEQQVACFLILVFLKLLILPVWLAFKVHLYVVLREQLPVDSK